MTGNVLLLAGYTASSTAMYIKREKKWLPEALLWKEHQFRHKKGTVIPAKQSGKKCFMTEITLIGKTLFMGSSFRYTVPKERGRGRQKVGTLNRNTSNIDTSPRTVPIKA